MLNIHPALIGAGESGKTSYKSPWILGHSGTWGRRKSNRRLAAQAEMGKKCSGDLGLPSRGVYFGTRKEGGTARLLGCVCTSTFSVPSHNPNYACSNMKLVIGMQMADVNGTENVNRVIQAKVQIQDHSTKWKCTRIRGISIRPGWRVTDHSIMLPSLPF